MPLCGAQCQAGAQRPSEHTHTALHTRSHGHTQASRVGTSVCRCPHSVALVSWILASVVLQGPPSHSAAEDRACRCAPRLPVAVPWAGGCRGLSVGGETGVQVTTMVISSAHCRAPVWASQCCSAFQRTPGQTCLSPVVLSPGRKSPPTRSILNPPQSLSPQAALAGRSLSGPAPFVQSGQASLPERSSGATLLSPQSLPVQTPSLVPPSCFWTELACLPY